MVALFDSSKSRILCGAMDFSKRYGRKIISTRKKCRRLGRLVLYRIYQQSLILGVGKLRKEIGGNGTAAWYRVAKTSNLSTIGGIIGYVSYENIEPLIFSFVMVKSIDVTKAVFKFICGNQNGLKQYFRYKNTTDGWCLWIKTVGFNTNSFVIPTLQGSYSSFDIVREDPPEDALEPTFS